MSKVTLINTETGKPQEFEPVDAREVLAQEGTIYAVPEDAEKRIAMRLESSATADINVPQLQGTDSDLQTGESTEKYGREAVDKAEPGAVDNSGADAADETPARRGRKPSGG
jgi:hypothetical protein